MSIKEGVYLHRDLETVAGSLYFHPSSDSILGIPHLGKFCWDSVFSLKGVRIIKFSAFGNF